MQNNGFQPFGPTVAVDSSTQYAVPTTNGQQATSYRVRNTSTAAAYIAWAPSLTTSGALTAPTIATPAAIVAGAPIARSFGMVAGSVEVFVLPQNCYFKGSSAATFEVTPGEGI